MEPETEERKPRRSPFGCLFSGTLGCGAFLFGAVISVALFAPTMLGDVVAGIAKGEFHKHCDGRLMIDDLQLSWADRQRATGVKILDLEGQEVVVFNTRFPSLLTMLGVQQGSTTWEVEILRARLEIDGDGISNLDHALADRGRPFDWIGSIESSLVERPPGWQAEDGAAAGEWAWTSFAVRATAGAVSIRDVRQAVDPVSLEELDLEVLAGPGGDTRAEDRAIVQGTLRFAGAGSCRIQLSRPLSKLDWSGLVEGEAVPTRLVGSLVGDGGRLHTLLGPQCDGSLRFAPVDGGRAGALRVEGELSAEPSRVQWAVVLDGEEVCSADRAIALQILAPRAGELSAEATRWLLPWLDPQRAEVREGDEVPRGVQIDVDALTYSRRGGIASLNGVATVTLGESAYPPIRDFADDLGLSGDLMFQVEAPDPIAIRVEDGILRYEQIAMTIAGHRCTFTGHHSIEDGRIEVDIEVPLRFVGRRMMDQGVLDQLVVPGLTVPVQLEGTWRNPDLDVNLRILQEAMSLNFKSAVKSTATGFLSKTIEALTPSSDE